MNGKVLGSSIITMEVLANLSKQGSATFYAGPLPCILSCAEHSLDKTFPWTPLNFFLTQSKTIDVKILPYPTQPYQNAQRS